MADDTDPWAQRQQNISKLVAQPTTSAPSPDAPAATPPAAGQPGSPPPTAAPTPGTLDPIAAKVHQWLGLPTPDAAPMPAPGSAAASARDTATAAVGGMYDVGSTIARNLGATPNPLSADAQAAMAAHPYATTAGNLLAGTAAAIPIGAAAEVAAPLVGIGTGLGGSILTGAATGAAQNALAGSPDLPLWERGLIGAGIGGTLGAVANRVGGWFGAGRSIPSEVADAAKTAQREGVTDINPSNLPSRGDIKATGATPTYEQAGQIDNATSKILGQDVPNWNSANLNTVKNNIGGDISQAARSGQISATPGSSFDQALTQIQQFAKANGVGSDIDPLINQIRARIKNGVISGQDFDNLVGAGSPLHDLVGSDKPFVKQAAQALDRVMDAGFQASSPTGAYDAWVDARTKYRMLMGVEKAVLPNGHIDPAALFRSVLNRFTDMKGVPVSSDPLVGRMGEFANSIKTLFGGRAAPSAQSSAPGLWQTIKELGIGSLPAAANALTSGNIASPENFLTPSSMTGWGLAGADLLGQWAGRAYQQLPRFANALIDAGGAPIANPISPAVAAAQGTQAFPQRRAQPRAR